jgi:thioredoxin reductase
VHCPYCHGWEIAGQATGILDTAEGRLTGVRMHDGQVIARPVLVVAPRMTARSHVLSSLGLHPVPHPLGTAVGELIESDPNGRTAFPGVWVAGNVTDIQAQVITAAAAQGLAAAAAINADLIAEETRRAVEYARVRDAAGPRIRDTVRQELV